MNPDHSQPSQEEDVLRLADIDLTQVIDLLQRYNLTFNLIQDNSDIPGSFWGEEEAGLISNQVFARSDTPVHSLLHESCHYICMDESRRHLLHTNAGGTADEENAVCYLQILLSNELSFMDSDRMMRDMDTWGYSFRLGSCSAWYENDTQDEVEWLLTHKLITKDKTPTFALRQ